MSDNKNTNDKPMAHNNGLNNDCMPCLPYAYQDQDIKALCPDGLPLSQFYDYRRRYSPLADCELNYFDSACSNFTNPSLPKSYYSGWGRMYKNWKCSQGDCPPDEYHYRNELFNQNKKTQEHPFLYKGQDGTPTGTPSPMKTMFQNPMEPFMNCGIEGSTFILLASLLLLYLIYDKYFA